MKPLPCLFAQAGDEVAAESSTNTEPPASLPHGQFLGDYLLVAALLAGALYAVCRSSRRA